MTKHNVSGGWVDLRDPKDVPERLRRKITNLSVEGAPIIADLQEKQTPDRSDIEFIENFNDNLALALVSNWSFEFPFTIEGLLDLPGPVYDEIQALCRPMIKDLMPNFGVDPDPKVITEPSSELSQP